MTQRLQPTAVPFAGATTSSPALLAPVILTLAYPFLLATFHHALDAAGQPAGVPSATAGWLSLCAALAVPLVALAWAHGLRGESGASGFRVRVRLLAYATIGAPPLFTLIGVVRGLVGRPLTDESVWLGVWLLAVAAVCLPRRAVQARIEVDAPSPRWRVAHGIAAAFILLFVGFHLANHLAGLAGPSLHGAIMAAGRKVYRFLPVEVVLVGLLLFQVASGLALASRWGRKAGDGFRVLQVGSGLYLAAFVVTHLNSALVSARAVRHLDTNWDWASGGAEGLLHDAWNVRLVPHYGYGAFFVMTHLLLGLRQVAIAHGLPPRAANRLWAGAMVVAAGIAAAIVAALLGVRLP